MKTKPCTPTGELKFDVAGVAYVTNATVAILDEIVPVRSKPKG